jgi:antitoxin ParD1/3/4
MSLNVSLTPHLEEFIHQTVQSGRFQSASEVVRTALRLLEYQEQERKAHLEWLRSEIQKGLDSGPIEPLTDDFWPELHDKLRAKDAQESHD